MFLMYKQYICEIAVYYFKFTNNNYYKKSKNTN